MTDDEKDELVLRSIERASHAHQILARAFERMSRAFENPRCRLPGRQQRAVLTAGQGKVEQMSYSIQPGQTKTLNVVFCDAAVPPVVHPLGSLPTATDTTGVAGVSPLGTPQVTDPSFSWSVSCPATATIGTQLLVDVKGTNPDGVVDEQTYTIDVVAADDTTQQATFA